MEPMGRPAKVIPFPGPARRAGARGLVEVHRCDQAEALVVKALFESEDIPTVLRAGQVAAVYPFSVGEQGRVAVLVREADVPRSRILLARIASRHPVR
jgi:hypothetical protein